MSQNYIIKKPRSFCFLIAIFFPVFFFGCGVQAEENDYGFEIQKGALLQKTIKGTVLGKDGNPVIGATVSEKGTANATTTDVDGNFSLNLSDKDATLVVSSIGYKTVEIQATQAGSITLEVDESALEEVVVVGYGTQKKGNMTSAVSEVDAKVLQDRPAPTVVNMLQGAAPGLVVSRNSGQPGSQGLNIQIRGATSANGNVPPLIVIDGVISSESTFMALSPSDIKSISVLKDGGATAIYGAQSAGGVLLITTKQGESGRSTISLSSNTGWQRPSNIPERLSLFDEMNYMNLARKNAKLAPEYTEEDLNYALNGPVFVEGANGQWRTYNQESIIDQVVQKSYPIFTNNAQFSGGNEKVTYMASLGNMTQNGMFKVGDDRFSRWNARANISARVTDFFKVDIRSAYVDQASDLPQDGGWGLDGGGASLLRQFYSSRMRFPIYNEDGTYYRSGTSSAFGYALMKDGGFNTDRRGTYFNNVTATVDNLIKGLEVRLMYGREDIKRETRNFRRTVSYFSGPGPETESRLNDPNNYNVVNYSTIRQNYQAIVDYGFALAGKHNIDIMGGYQFVDYDYRYISASTKNLYVNDNPSLNFTSDPLNKSHNQKSETQKMQSYFGRLNYNFQEKYLFEATIRSDESSRLAPGVRTKVFPSFSAGWNVSQEEWFGSISHVVNELKPRVSWGKVGSASVSGMGYYNYIAQLVTNTNVLIGNARQTYIYQNLLEASRLSWETIETRNFGLDFSFLNRKLRGSFDYYEKFNNNMMVSVNLPATIGLAIPKSNEGKLKTWGWEAALSYNDRIGDDFTYSVALNIADNQNRLINFGGASDIVIAGVNKTVEGYALNSIWGYRTDGYFQNEEDLSKAPSYKRLKNVDGVPGIGDVRYVDVDGDGEISPGGGRLSDLGDLVYLGSTNPRYQFGLSANLGYKNFDFSFFIQGIGKRRFKPSNELIQPALYSWYMPMSFHTDYWTAENRNATFPRPYLEGNHNYQASDKWFMNGAYARLKNIQLGYTIKKDNIPSLPFSRVRVFVSGEDLLTVSSLGVFKGVVDPEMKPEDNKVSPYPFATTVSFGLNLDF